MLLSLSLSMKIICKAAGVTDSHGHRHQREAACFENNNLQLGRVSVSVVQEGVMGIVAN